MASGSELTLFAALLLLSCPAPIFADKLQITSNPSGATVELDGVAVGSTPFEKDFPGGYFRKTRTSMGSRLEHPVVARISLSGYATRELKLTEGPMNWISLNDRNRGEYWLFKSDHFSVDLLPISETFTGAIIAKVSDAGVGLQPELSLEELVRQAKPAVVYLKGLESSGSGFFVTGTGVIVTNAHLARGEETLLTILSNGQQLEARVVHIDPDLDIALAKVERPPAKVTFLISPLPTPPAFARAKTFWPSAIQAMPCSSASRKASSAPSELFPTPVPAPGFRPTLPSIPATAAARSSTPAAKSSASTRKNSSRKMSLASASPSAPRIFSKFSIASIPTPCRSPRNSPPPLVNQPLRTQASSSQARALNSPSHRRSLHRPPPMASAQSLFPRIPTAPKSSSMTNSSATLPPL